LFQEPTPIEPGGSHDGSLSSRGRRGGRVRPLARCPPSRAQRRPPHLRHAARDVAQRDASRDAAEVGRLRIRPLGPGPWGLVLATIAPSAGCPTTTRTSPWGSRRSGNRARLPAAVRTALEPVTIDRVSRADGGFRLELSDGELVHPRRVVGRWDLARRWRLNATLRPVGAARSTSCRSPHRCRECEALAAARTGHWRLLERGTGDAVRGSLGTRCGGVHAIA
jgi:hypothetical protein